MKNKNQIFYEFIGKKISVIDSSCKTLVGIQGRIIDETKNTFIIETNNKNKIKKLLKNQIIFTIDDNNTIINGKEITKRPEERLKMRI